MRKNPLSIPSGFLSLLQEIKQRIQKAQSRAVLAANAELVRLYWDIGCLIGQQQHREGWGAAVIPRIARELRSEIPEVKGFSERNIKLMVQFANEYPDVFPAVPAIRQPSVAQLPSATNGQPLVAQIPWAHNVLLMQRVKDHSVRTWYMQQTLTNGWSRNVLLTVIQSGIHSRQGKAITNFGEKLPSPQSDLARQSLKDPYIFDFLTIQEPFHERELETGLLEDVRHFLMELGQGFAFVGRQHRIEVADTDYYIDLLFYHLKLRCFVVIDLKKGEFKPEYAGKMNFYLTVVDDKLRNEHDAPSIGLILCQDRNHVIAEYALQRVNSPIGVSQYELTRALPTTLKSALPTVEEIEAELADAAAGTQVLTTPKAPKLKATKSARPTTRKQTKKRRKK